MDKEWFSDMVVPSGALLLEEVVPFGKYRWHTVAQILAMEPNYFYGYTKHDIIHEETRLSEAIRLAISLIERRWADNAEARCYPRSEAECGMDEYDEPFGHPSAPMSDWDV